MKYFLPDASDLVDPSFDFVTETRAPDRLRQRDDLYAHEVFERAPFNGYLVSKAMVEGIGSAARYSIAQRQRLLRCGARSYFRLESKHQELEMMGDCGAFSYVKEKTPPFSVDSVMQFYVDCGFDYGFSVDHVILGFRADLDAGLPGINAPPIEWKERQHVTLELADQFIESHKRHSARFTPIGVAQGWSPNSYSSAALALEKMGFSYIALGGIVPLRTNEILSVLEAVRSAVHPSTKLHLLGVTRTEQLGTFSRFGVASFDSTSPLRQAFKDDRDNFYTLDRTYTAIRIPQVEGNLALQRKIRAGSVDNDLARRLEAAALKALMEFGHGACSIETVLGSLRDYDDLLDPLSDRSELYRETLSHRPWDECKCNVCRSIGIHVVVFRGAERNRRRGFHNVFIFEKRLRRELAAHSLVSERVR